MKRMFQYCVLQHIYEVTDGKRVYKDTKVITDVSTILEKDEKSAVFKITRQIPEEAAQNPEDVEIRIRDF